MNLPPAQQVLPFDRDALYFGPVLQAREAAIMERELNQVISWQADTVRMFGRMLTLEREVAWYGDADLTYTYSGVPRHSLPWIPVLAELKHRVEQLVGSSFNACLLNRYHHGRQGMGWHADNEASLGPEPVIASLSLGAARPFAFQHQQNGQKISLLLESGSLLLMRGATQHAWKHALPKTARVKNPRINLTFRTIIK